MDNADNKIIKTQPEQVDYIVSKSCDYLGVQRDMLTKNIGTRSPIWLKKRFIAYVLSKNTILSYREIGVILGFNSHVSVSFHVKNMENDLSDNVYGSAKIKTIYNELLSYLKLDNYGNKANNQTEKTNQKSKE